MGRYQNVVFIVLDALRRDRVSLYNEDVDFTDNLEALGAESLVFEDVIAQAPWTLPSHASMFTGTYPWEHGATQQSPIFEPDGPTLVDRFAGAGYRTAGFTPNPWVSPFSGLAAGFDEWDNFLTPSSITLPDFSGYSKILEWWSTRRFERFKTAVTDMADSLFETWTRRQGANVAQTERVISRGKRFVQDRSTERPFFLYLNLLDAHEPYYPPAEYRERYAPAVDPRKQCQIPSRYLKGEREADFESIGKLYDASVAYMDDVVGEFVEFLRGREILDETVLVIISDHGQALGEDGLYGHQYGVSPELIEVPMLVRDPSGQPGRIDQLVELRELFEYLPALADVGSEYTPGVDIAAGGYGYPDLAIRQLPDGRRSEYYKRFRYAVNDRQSVVQVETEDGVSMRSTDRDSGETVPASDHLLESIPLGDKVGQAATEFGDPVESRLEDLGYL